MGIMVTRALVEDPATWRLLGKLGIQGIQGMLGCRKVETKKRKKKKKNYGFGGTKCFVIRI